MREWRLSEAEAAYALLRYADKDFQKPSALSKNNYSIHIEGKELVLRELPKSEVT